MAKSVKRLFRHFHPSSYKLLLNIDSDNLSFSGNVQIIGQKVGPPSHRITLHAKDLQILNASVEIEIPSSKNKLKKTYTKLPIVRINYQKSLDEVRLHFKSKQTSGIYRLKLNFQGQITSQMNGLYPANFQLNGKTQTIIASQLESHHAREVFPCIDEPQAKAVFDLGVEAKKQQTVLSNMPIIEQKISGHYQLVKFGTSPIMSTYLLAVIVGDLKYLSATSESGIKVNVYATANNYQNCAFALDVAVKILDFFNQYFAIDYPLPKCDLVALPDFASGAMENWGLITFREQALIVDPKNTSLAIKQYVAMVIAHEMAHQWFGNLVTMEWWDDLWLNEGFASWIEYLAVDHLFKEWQIWNQLLVDERTPALKLDSLANSHPIVVPIKDPAEIRTIFDAISYNKGSSVINMLHRFLGAENFQKGLRLYLKRFAYKNSQTDDLWQALSEASGQNVKSFMSDWTKVSGYPLLTVIKSDENKITVSQNQFLAQGKNRPSSTKIWPIPLLRSHDDQQLLTKIKDEIPILSPLTHKLNRGGIGFYRTIYDSSLIASIGQQIQSNQLPPGDRLDIIGDVFEAAKAGYCSTVQAFKWLEFYDQEDYPAVWEVIVAQLASVRLVMDDPDLRRLIKKYSLKLIDKQLNRLGWKVRKNDSHFDILLRPLILGVAGANKQTEVIKTAQAVFAQATGQKNISPTQKNLAAGILNKNLAIDPDLRSIIYTIVARHGQQSEFDQLWYMHNESQSSEERLNLTLALTSFNKIEYINQSLKLIRSQNVRIQDVLHWLAYSFMNRFAKKATWNWMIDNWQWLDDKLGNDMAFSRLPIYTARSFSDKKFLKEYDDFFEKKRSPALDRSIAQGREMIMAAAEWRIRDQQKLKKYLRAKLGNLSI